MKQFLIIIALIIISTNLLAQQLKGDTLLQDAIKQNQDLQNYHKIDNAIRSPRIINIHEYNTYNRDEPLYELSRYKIRGYGSRYSQTFINNIPTNNIELGYSQEFILDGLDFVSNNYKKYSGLNSSDISIGTIGGHKLIDLRPSNHKKGSSLTYSNLNNKYKNNLLFTYSTGLMQNGWSITASGSKRWANEGYVEGTFYNAYSYFLAIEKQINTKQNIVFTFLGAPTKFGEQGATYQEVYDLTGTNYYNPYWGWQDGKKRNSREKSINKPIFVLNHDWKLNKKSTLFTSVSYMYGNRKQSALYWFQAYDPRPDYYRYLPSYFSDSEAASMRAEEFANGERQIQWESLYDWNLYQIDTVYNANGLDNKVAGYESEYIIENRHYDEKQFSVNTIFEKLINKNLKFIAGIQHRHYKGSHYKTVEDLLGGDFIVDYNKYQNDIRTPNRIVRESDRFGYDYNSNIRKTEAWLQTQFNYRKFAFNFAGKFVNTSFWRTGNMQNGLFPENSLGDSEKQTFEDYSLKANIIFKLNRSNLITFNSEYSTVAPYFSNSFLSVGKSNDFVNDLKSEKIFALNVGYKLRLEKITASANYYYTNFNDQASIRSYYSNDFRSFINLSMSQINRINQGYELTFEGKITSKLTARAIGSVGYYKWLSHPAVKVTLENTHEVLIENDVSILNGFTKQETEQMAASMGLEYKSKGWLLRLNANYYDDIYLSFNPTARDVGTEDDFETNDNEYKFQEFIYQDKLPRAFTMDFFIGKSIKFYNKYLLSLTFNVNNVLNNTDFISGGYERMPIDYSVNTSTNLQPKYYYNYGITYFLNLNLRF